MFSSLSLISKALNIFWWKYECLYNKCKPADNSLHLSYPCERFRSSFQLVICNELWTDRGTTLSHAVWDGWSHCSCASGLCCTGLHFTKFLPSDNFYYSKWAISTLEYGFSGKEAIFQWSMVAFMGSFSDSQLIAAESRAWWCSAGKLHFVPVLALWSTGLLDLNFKNNVKLWPGAAETCWVAMNSWFVIDGELTFLLLWFD